MFSGAVESAPANAAAGATVRIVSAGGEMLGYGAYSPASNIRVRMLKFGDGEAPDDSFAAGLVRRAIELRRALRPSVFEEPGAALRLVNAENDGLPGVIADFYSGWVVCQFTSALGEAWKATIAAALASAVPGCRGVAERADADARVREGLEKGGFAVLAGEEPPGLIEISEGGIRYLVDVRNGHKTGFYLDQRAARKRVRALASGRDVLNCFSYTGGFGLAAAAGGARSVVQVDVSADALALAGENAALNAGLRRDAIVCEEADVFKYLRQCRDAARTFDMIVLDPPKFAETRSQAERAARGYKDINLLAMKLLQPGGILATFSCSGAISSGFFDQILAGAAEDARRDFQIIARTGHDFDHPVALSFPEGAYLKGVFLRASDEAAKA